MEKEAPNFLADLLHLELPSSPDRLNVPAIETEDKHLAQRLNQTQLELFISEKCQSAAGRMIKFSELFDKFQEWLDPNELSYWSKIKVGRDLPPQFPKGRLRTNGQFYIGNICWTGEPTADSKTALRLVLKDDYLEPISSD